MCNVLYEMFFKCVLNSFLICAMHYVLCVMCYAFEGLRKTPGKLSKIEFSRKLVVKFQARGVWPRENTRLYSVGTNPGLK